MCASRVAPVERAQPIVCVKCSKRFYVEANVSKHADARTMMIGLFFLFNLCMCTRYTQRDPVVVCDKTQLFATLAPRLLPIKSPPSLYIFFLRWNTCDISDLSAHISTITVSHIFVKFRWNLCLIILQHRRICFYFFIMRVTNIDMLQLFFLLSKLYIYITLLLFKGYRYNKPILWNMQIEKRRALSRNLSTRESNKNILNLMQQIPQKSARQYSIGNL